MPFSCIAIATPTIIQREVASTVIQITCYDRTGKEVKRVTSTSGDVEEPEDTVDNGGEGTNTGENQNGGTGNISTGGGDDNGGGMEEG